MTGEAGGKLLLFGEHAAVYGHPAVGLGLPLRLQVRFRRACEGDETGVAAERLSDACRHIGIDTSVADGLEVRSEIPFGVGLGSSSALCVALARAVGDQTNSSCERRYWDIAHRAECAFHGSPSGIDTGLALLGGVQRFTPTVDGRVPSAQPIIAQLIYLVAGFVPRSGNTASYVKSVKRRIQSEDTEVCWAIDRLGAIVEPACLLLASSVVGRVDRLGKLADEANVLLTHIGVGSPAVDELLNAARAGGATGGKISGGGGGGAFVAFVPDQATGLGVLNEVAERLPVGRGAAAMLIAVDHRGTELLADHGWPPTFTRRVRLTAF